MRTIFITIPTLLLVLLLILFSIANRHSIVVYLDPVPLVLDMPAYLLLFIGIFVGVFLTGLALAGRRLRQSGRLRRSRLREKALEKRVGELESGASTDIRERLQAIDRAQATDPGAKSVVKRST